jgi:malonyl-ACP O-methyltransferase BioC
MHSTIIQSFDRAATSYDHAAQLQQIVAQKLVARATTLNPATILDIGCGTGLVSALAAAKYPRAHIAGIDTSSAMLVQARKKAPNLITQQADAGDLKFDQKFDLIFSSMLLHWLPHPEQILRQWQNLLAPGGMLHVALPIKGSLSEWRDLCRANQIEDGLWHFPPADFTPGDRIRETIIHENLHGFLGSLKQTGAHKAHPGHTPLATTHMRKLLNTHTGIFTVSFDILYLSVAAA